MTSNPSLPRTAIIDGPTVGWLIQTMNTDPGVLDVFNLSSFIEAIALHDKIKLVFWDNPTPLEQELKNAAQQGLKILIDSGLLELWMLPKETSTTTINRPPSSAKPIIVNADEDFTAWYLLQSVRFVIAERTSEDDAVILPIQAPLYKMNRRIRADDSICDLFLNYSTVRELAEEARRQSRINSNHVLERVLLPPIALETLRNAGGLDTIWDVTADTWDRFKNIRLLHSEMRWNLEDSASTPKRREREARKLRESWNQLLRRWETRVASFSGANTTDDLRHESLSMEGLSIDFAGNFSIDPSAPLKWAQTIWSLYSRLQSRWRLRQIHDSLEAYWSTSDREIYNHVERLFRISVTDNDHNDVVRWEREDKEIIGCTEISDLFPV